MTALRRLAIAVAMLGALTPTLPGGESEPVLLLHGLWGNEDTWSEYSSHLREAGWREGCALRFAPQSTDSHSSVLCREGGSGERAFYRVVFHDNDGQTFEVQGAQVAAAVAEVRRRTGAFRVILVGHSMGGLAARAYMQSETYRGDVSALATVNTPHMGSLLPYLRNEPGAWSCSLLASLSGRSLDAPAVGMLAPDAPALVALNRPDKPWQSLPTGPRYLSVVGHYEVSTEAGPNCVLHSRDWLANWQKGLAAHFDPARSLSLASGDVMAGWTDGVVPVVSQMLRASPAAIAVEARTVVVQAAHSAVTGSTEAWRALDVFLGPASVAAAKPSDAIDVIFVIDTTASMSDDIDAVKASASSIIDGLYKASHSVRLALVAYRDYGDEYVTRGYAFTEDREAMQRHILGLTVAGGGDQPEAVYDALLDAIYTKEIGAWRNGVKKVVILMGDAPPHTRRHTEDEVVKAAEEVDPAHIFPIRVAGASPEASRLFARLATRTGGVMGTTRTAADLPREVMRMVEMGGRLADEASVPGRVSAVLGDTLEIDVASGTSVRPGMIVLVGSRETPALIVAEGRVTAGEGNRIRAELRALFGTEAVAVGCEARVLLRD